MSPIHRLFQSRGRQGRPIRGSEEGDGDPAGNSAGLDAEPSLAKGRTKKRFRQPKEPRPRKRSSRLWTHPEEPFHANPQGKIVAVVVTFNPHLGDFERLLRILRPQVDAIVVVDNCSINGDQVEAAARRRAANPIKLPENMGVAAAQNMGIRWALAEGASYVLLSDQDSTPSANLVTTLWQIADANPQVAAVGPVPVDERGTDGIAAADSPPTSPATPENALVYSFTKWGPKRRLIPGPGEAIWVPFALASGSLLSARALEQVGPMDEFLFIDHVDLAWGLRSGQAGFKIVVTGDAVMEHQLGDQVAFLPRPRGPVSRRRGTRLAARRIHLHGPERNYYLVRNTLFLLRSPFLKRAWKWGYTIWLGKYVAYYALYAPGRLRRLAALGQGINDGLIGRGGPR